MAELWLPNLNDYPEINNPFDMMLVFQDQLSEHENFRSAQQDAFFAIRALSKMLEQMSEKQRELEIKTSGAVIKSVEGGSDILVRNDIGVVGTLDDVHAVPIKLDDKERYYISLILEIEAIYKMSDPSAVDMIMRPGSVPISMVDVIESAA